MLKKTPNCEWVGMDDLNDPRNALHLKPEDYKVLGQHFVDKAIDMTNSK